MTDKRILMLGETSGFMVNAIINGLKKEDFKVETSAVSIGSLSKLSDIPKIIILYLDDHIVEEAEALTYLKDQVFEKELTLYLVGSKEEIEKALKIIPEGIVGKILERPLNVKDLLAVLDKEMEKEALSAAKKKILVVDDDPTMLRTIKTLLSSKYNVYMANSGMNAITFLAKTEVDLILLDYEMPVITGAKVLEMIRSEASTADIPVMFLTSKSDKESVMEVLALKPVKYLLKTMPPEEWIRNIDEFFDSVR